MPGVITIEGAKRRSKSKSGCRCTKKGRTLCPVPKSKKHRSGWSFVKDKDPRALSCERRRS